MKTSRQTLLPDEFQLQGKHSIVDSDMAFDGHPDLKNLAGQLSRDCDLVVDPSENKNNSDETF